MSTALNASIAGATGQIYEYGRREKELDSNKRHYRQVDWEDLPPDLQKPEVVLITLGTTRANAGSAEAFLKIDQHYVVDFARASRDSTNAKQRLVYCSAVGATAKSPFLYPKSKGQTETRLSELGYETIVFRPNYLAGVNRPEKRLVEDLYGKVTGFLSHLTDSARIEIKDLGAAMVTAGRIGVEGLQKAGIGSEHSTGGGSKIYVLNNAEAIKLSRAKL